MKRIIPLFAVGLLVLTLGCIAEERIDDPRVRVDRQIRSNRDTGRYWIVRFTWRDEKPGSIENITINGNPMNATQGELSQGENFHYTIYDIEPINVTFWIVQKDNTTRKTREFG
jgi:hypothetical protein